MGRRRKAVWLVAALVSAWTGAAAAAAPRDAIQGLPILSHTSELNINSNEAARTYQDVYRGTWRIDWLTKEIKLPGAALRAELDYATTLSDSLDKLNRSSSDSREDRFNFRLDLSSPTGLRGSYGMDQSDVGSNRTPSSNPRVWRSIQNKELALRWEQPRLPTVYARHAVRTTNEYFGRRQSSGSEEITTTFGALYDTRIGDAPQSYRAETTIRQTEGYLPQRSSSSQRRNNISGVRSMALGAMGMLTLDYDYTERSDARPGQLEAVTNSEGSYGMSVYGSVKGLPLEYSYNYRNVFRSFQSAPGELQSSSDLSFTFTPKLAGNGRSARFSLRNYLLDYEASASHTAQNLQSLNVSFAANPRVTGQFGYERNQYNNELSGALSSERERIQAEVRYAIPRGAGDYYGGFTQEVGREPDGDNVSVSSGLRAGVNFNLDQRSRLQIFLDQQRSSNRSGSFGQPRSTDTVSSGFTYAIASGQGLSLNATWRQILQETQPSAASSNTQQLNLTLNYDTPAGWKYQLNIRSNDYSRDSLTGGERSYSTEDSIQALMSYSF